MTLLLTSLFGAAPTLAALGESEASVTRDATHLSGTVKVTAHPAYRIHEIQAASGTVVREFLGPANRVFAVAWKGPAAPDLRATLGQYFDAFAASVRSGHAGRHHLTVSQGDLVVESSGHMRAYSGLAYLPSAVPGGVALSELR